MKSLWFPCVFDLHNASFILIVACVELLGQQRLQRVPPQHHINTNNASTANLAGLIVEQIERAS